MTTLLGIKTNVGRDAIVVISDNQVTEYEDERIVSRRPMRKLYTGDHFATGDVGNDDRDILQIYESLRKSSATNGSVSKNPILERIVQEKFFNEVRDLNTMLSRRGVGLDSMHELILATNHPTLSLYWIDAFGNLREPSEENAFEYICLGSGADEVSKYIMDALKEEKIERDNLNISIAVQLARDCLNAAEKDICTGLGYDIAIVTAGEIKSWGRDIKQAMRAAEKRKLGEIGEYYSKQEEKPTQP